MAEQQSDEQAKEEMAKGMAEAGKEARPKPRKPGQAGSSGTDEVSKGMSKSGTGIPTADQPGSGASKG